MKRFLLVALPVVAVAAVIAMLLGWIPGPVHGTWRLWEVNPSVLTVSSADPAFQSAQETAETSEEMVDALPPDAWIQNPLELSSDTGLPAEGVTLTYSLERALGHEFTAHIAAWNPSQGWWEPVPTTISEDRRVLTATATHFSVWAWLQHTVTEGSSLAYNGLGQLLGTKVSEPDCEETTPDWADPTYVEDRNSIVLWCYDDGDHSDELRVKLRLNRPYVGLIQTGIPARVVRSDLPGPFGQSPPRLEQILVDAGRSATDLGVSGYPVLPLGEYTFTFGREELAEFFRSSDAPLLEVTTSPMLVLLGELVRMGLDDSTSTWINMIVTVVSLAQCGGGVVEAAADAEPIPAAGSVADCLSDNAEDIARATARIQVARDPGVSWETAIDRARSAGRAIGRAWVYWNLLEWGMKLTEIAADQSLDPIVRQFWFAPSDDYLSEFVTGESADPEAQYLIFAADFTDRSGFAMHLWLATGAVQVQAETRDAPPGYTYVHIDPDPTDTGLPIWGLDNLNDRPLVFDGSSVYVYPQASPTFGVRLVYDRTSIVCESFRNATEVGSALPTCGVYLDIARVGNSEPELTIPPEYKTNLRPAPDQAYVGLVPGVREADLASVMEALAHPDGFQIVYSGDDARRFDGSCGEGVGFVVLHDEGAEGTICTVGASVSVSGSSR